MLGMRIQTFVYGTPSGVYTMDVHESCDCYDLSYHISANQTDGAITDASSVRYSLSRLEGVVAVTMVTDRHFIVETSQTWDSIEPKVLIVLSGQFDLEYLLQNHGGPKTRIYNDRLWLIMERSLANSIGSRRKPVDGIYGEINRGDGLIASMEVLPDENPGKRRVKENMHDDTLGIVKGDRHSPPTPWDWDGRSKYGRHR